MSVHGGRTRVAVLGGGAASIAAAFELTASPQLRERFEVTVYSAGWRLGGKGASGRNARVCRRVEEHGLHVWFGFYEHAFELMRRCYEELGADAPASPWTAAFTPVERLVLWELHEGRRHPWSVRLPSRTLEHREPPLEPAERFAPETTRSLVELWTELGLRRADGSPEPPPELLEAAARAQLPLEDLSTLESIGGLLDRAARETEGAEGRAGGWRARLFRSMLDLSQALMRGLVEDGVLRQPLSFDPDAVARLNEQDLREWLRPRVRWEETLDTSLLRTLYDLAFAYDGGDAKRPNVAAGMALENAFRIAFGHRGSFMLRLEGGMGDVVFAPLLRVLERRGVAVELFHWVERLGASDDGRAVETIDFVRQAEPLGGRYEPLVRLRDGTLAWPSEPRWEQLVDGESLKQRRVDFEREPNPDRRPPRTLRRGEDFDSVVLGVPVGGLGPICEELAASNAELAAMLRHSRTVMTQAVQLWLAEPAPRCGLAPRAGAISGGDRKPFDTYCDMSHLIAREEWPGTKELVHIAYLVGVLADETGGHADARVREAARQFARERLGPDPSRVLVGPDGRRGGSVADQYARANWSRWERYATTPKGSVKHRLAAGWRGFENLALAGDWTKTPIDAGSVEAAVLSGQMAAAALTGVESQVG